MRVPINPGATFSFGAASVASEPPENALMWELGPDNAVYWLVSEPSRTVMVVNWAREVDSLLRQGARSR